MTRVVAWNRPVEARLVIQALSSPTRVAMLRMIADKAQGATASELAKALSLSLPTALEHLSILLGAGLIRWEWRVEGRRSVRVYKLVDRRVAIQLDLDAYTHLPELEELKSMMISFVERSMEGKGLPAKPTVSEVEKLLGVDSRTAIAVVDYMLKSEEEIVDHLASKAMPILEGVKEITTSELAAKLKIHEYWAARIARKLEEKGLFIVEAGKLRRVEE